MTGIFFHYTVSLFTGSFGAVCGDMDAVPNKIQAASKAENKNPYLCLLLLAVLFMTIREINQSYNRITGALESRELKEAFDHLQGLIAGTQEYVFQDRMESLQDTYKYMLQYRVQGVEDPMQEEIYKQVISSLYELADEVRQKALLKDSPLSYYSRKRILQQTGEEVTFSSLYNVISGISVAESEGEIKREARQCMEDSASTLFYKIWTSFPLTTEEVVGIRRFMDSADIFPDTKCLVVSGLTLALQNAFDREKLELLFDAASGTEEMEVRVRALVGILLTLYIYRKRIWLYDFIGNRLYALAETSPSLEKTLRAIGMRFIISRETEKITHRLQNEIIPEMMKLSSKIGRKINLSDEFSLEHFEEGVNPEWQEKIFSDSKLEKLMSEYGELQFEGADVLHSTFIHLKNYPFFREMSNWFLPFNRKHSMLSKLQERGNAGISSLLDTIASSSFMCNSDTYSFYFSIENLPDSARSVIVGQMDAESAELMRQSKAELQDGRSKEDVAIGKYVQDLYRFYKLFPGHLDFTDIFTLPLDFHNLDILKPFMSGEECLRPIAELYLRKNYFGDALLVFSRLLETNPGNELLYQKIGYCKQMSNDLQGALDAYLHADLLNPGGKWLTKRIAACYKSLKQPAEALKYYQRYELLSPEDLSVQISIGHCFLELKEYREALKCYFKVDYLDTSDQHKAWRPIAWCSFLIGKYEQARNYYQKIEENFPEVQDYLNAGHVEWAMNNAKGALSYYKKSVAKGGNDWNKFRDLFEQDVPDLLNAGIGKDEIPLMLDAIRYELS